jgi:hypothetical protein
MSAVFGWSKAADMPAVAIVASQISASISPGLACRLARGILQRIQTAAAVKSMLFFILHPPVPWFFRGQRRRFQFFNKTVLVSLDSEE